MEHLSRYSFTVMFVLGSALCTLSTGCKSSAPASPNNGGASTSTAGANAGGQGAVPVAGASTTTGTAGTTGAAGITVPPPAAGVAGATPATDDTDGGAAGAAGSGDTANQGPDTGPFPAVTDFQNDGPFKSTELDMTGPNNNYTVYLPTELAPNGAKNPIVGWMSGGATTPSGYTLLPHLATHGFVVVASNTAPGIGDEVNLGKEIIAGIDWAIAENSRAGSQLQGKLDITKIASIGYSMGSLATFTIANDPRLTTTVHISGGNMEADRIMNLHAPAAFLCGIPGDSSCNILSTDCDIAAANCDTDFMNATTPVFYGNFPGGHLGILTEPNMDRIRTEATAWLRWQLMGDRTLKSRFVGDQCEVCKDPNWKVKQKNLK